jgi:hypothetical protein
MGGHSVSRPVCPFHDRAWAPPMRAHLWRRRPSTISSHAANAADKQWLRHLRATCRPADSRDAALAAKPRHAANAADSRAARRRAAAPPSRDRRRARSSAARRQPAKHMASCERPQREEMALCSSARRRAARERRAQARNTPAVGWVGGGGRSCGVGPRAVRKGESVP